MFEYLRYRMDIIYGTTTSKQTVTLPENRKSPQITANQPQITANQPQITANHRKSA